MSSSLDYNENWIWLPTGDLPAGCGIRAGARGNNIVGPFELVDNGDVIVSSPTLEGILTSPEYKRLLARKTQNDFKIVYRFSAAALPGSDRTRIEYDEFGDLIYVIEVADGAPIRTNKIEELYLAYYGNEEEVLIDTNPFKQGV